MALFGTDSSKMKTSTAVVVDLDYSTIEPLWSVPQLIRNVSVVNRITTFIKLADDFAEFVVILNIWKNAVPQDVMTEIIPFNHDTVNFMPHSDSTIYVQKIGGGDASFFITEMTPFYLRTEPPVLQDMLLIRFKALESIDASGSIK